jgi:hypothetical protein
MGFGSLFLSPCRVFTHLGLGLPGLRRLLPNCCVSDTELGRLGALLG